MQFSTCCVPNNLTNFEPSICLSFCTSQQGPYIRSQSMTAKPKGFSWLSCWSEGNAIAPAQAPGWRRSNSTMRGCSCAHADIAALKPGFFQRTILEFQFQTKEGWKRCKRMPTMTIQLSDSCCFGGIPRVNHLPGKKTVCWQPHIDFFSFHGTGVSSCSKCNTFLSSIRSEKLMQQQRALVEKVKSDHKVSSHWTTDFGGRNWGLVGSSDQRRPVAECQNGFANGSTQNKAIPLP